MQVKTLSSVSYSLAREMIEPVDPVEESRVEVCIGVGRVGLVHEVQGIHSVAKCGGHHGERDGGESVQPVGVRSGLSI